MTKSFVLRADGGAGLGIGHVKRCLAIASALRERGAETVFVLHPTEAGVLSLIEEAGVAYQFLPEGASLADETAALGPLALPSDAAIILDVSHRETVRESDAVPRYFLALAERFQSVIVIDSLLEDCLVGRFDLPVDLAVIPYVGAMEQKIASSATRLALGPDYFPLDRAYAPYVGKPRKIRAEASRVLVTAGGGDAVGLSQKTLAALQTIDDRRLSVRVVIGPAFTAETQQVIARLASDSRHDVELLVAPTELAEPMAWCDLAIAASGLTKYNLAAMATPAVLLSVDADHDGFHRAFERLGTARHLGVASEVPVPRLAAAARSLLHDTDARSAMSAAGSVVVDGKGMDRTLDAMFEVAAAGNSRHPGQLRQMAH